LWFISGPGDYCDHETFEAQCPNNQEVVIDSATYGRMRVGKCIEDNYRIGCQMDVLDVMDSLCSGMKTCSVPVMAPLLFSTKTKANVCPRLSVYLQASYNCLKGGVTEICKIWNGLNDAFLS
jgi:hypothetical protein